MKNVLDVLNSRLEIAKERISELENRVTGIIHFEEKRKKIEKQKQSLRHCGTILICMYLES